MQKCKLTIVIYFLWLKFMRRWKVLMRIGKQTLSRQLNFDKLEKTARQTILDLSQTRSKILNGSACVQLSLLSVQWSFFIKLLPRKSSMQVVYQLPHKLAQYCKTFSLAKQSDYHYKTSSTFSNKTPSTSSFFTPPVAENKAIWWLIARIYCFKISLLINSAKLIRSFGIFCSSRSKTKLRWQEMEFVCQNEMNRNEKCKNEISLSGWSNILSPYLPSRLPSSASSWIWKIVFGTRNDINEFLFSLLPALLCHVSTYCMKRPKLSQVSIANGKFSELYTARIFHPGRGAFGLGINRAPISISCR